MRYWPLAKAEAKAISSLFKDEDIRLDLTVDNGSHAGKLVLYGHSDVALRDLDFVPRLDDDGDGRLT